MAYPRILLTGAEGQVGFELQRSLAVLGDIVAVDRQDCDLADQTALHALLEEVKPDLIVNPAAYTAVDKAESEVALAHAINAHAPATIAQWAKQHNALLVHFSTDYIFDGNKAGVYVETDVPNPQSVYGQSKLAGENAVRASGCRHLIFRTSWVYGAHGGNFLKTMLRLMKERDSLKVISDQFGAPTSASLLADVTAQILAQYLQQQKPADFSFSTYHVVAGGETSWNGYAREINNQAQRLGIELRCAAEAIEPIPTSSFPLPAPRPANSRLSCNKLKTIFNLCLPEWQSGVQQVLTLLKD